jgi:hypothetical protein
MTRSVRLILEFLGVFIMGLACGALVMPQAPSSLDKFFVRTNDPQSMSERMMKKFTEKFHLTADEQTKLQPIVLQFSVSLYEERSKFGVDTMAIEDNYHQKMFAVLSPEHRALFESSYATYREHLSRAILIPPITPSNPALANSPTTTSSPHP